MSKEISNMSKEISWWGEKRGSPVPLWIDLETATTVRYKDATPKFRADKPSPEEFYILMVEDQPDEYFEALAKASRDALSTYGVNAKHIYVHVAETLSDAVNVIEMSARLWPTRPFDAALCDLEIPESPGGNKSTQCGFKVVEMLQGHLWEDALTCDSGKNRSNCSTDWYCGVVITTNFNYGTAELQARQRLRESASGSLKLDDFLGKQQHLGYKGNSDTHNREAVAKLQRILIPVHRYCAACKQIGLFFEHPKDLAILRQVSWMARRKYEAWPPARLLLLGDMGSGKGAFARAFNFLLPQHDGRPQESHQRLRIINSANLQKNDLSGRLTLNGAWNLHLGRDPVTSPGVFEHATLYRRDASAGNCDDTADPGDQLIWSEGMAAPHIAQGSAKQAGPSDGYLLRPVSATARGVVFLDEFADLSRTFQTMILTTLNDGIVIREGAPADALVPIGCHFVCATNLEVDKLTENIRSDLLSRIPYVLRVPSLKERRDTVIPMLQFMAKYRNQRLNRDAAEISITKSAQDIILAAVDGDIIHTNRDLEVIAELSPGELTISDSNLASVFSKAAALRRLHALDKARGLLAPELQRAFEAFCGDKLGHPADAGAEAQRLLDYQTVDLEMLKALKHMLTGERLRAYKVEDWFDKPGMIFGKKDQIPAPDQVKSRWNFLFGFALLLACRALGELEWKSFKEWFGWDARMEKFKTNFKAACKNNGLELKPQKADGPKAYLAAITEPKQSDNNDARSKQFIDHVQWLVQKWDEMKP